MEKIKFICTRFKKIAFLACFTVSANKLYIDRQCTYFVLYNVEMSKTMVKVNWKEQKCGLFQWYPVTVTSVLYCYHFLLFAPNESDIMVLCEHWACKNKLFGCCVVTCQCMIKTSENKHHRTNLWVSDFYDILFFTSKSSYFFLLIMCVLQRLII